MEFYKFQFHKSQIMEKIKNFSWKKLTAISAIILISYGLILQNLHSSEMLVFLFVCQCNHDSNKEIHNDNKKTQNQTSISLPDCHKKTNAPHVCSCKNGTLLKKMTDFLAQFFFVTSPVSLYFITFHKIQIVSINFTFLSEPFLFSLERPPSEI